jgi:hypothetical protein
MRALLCPTVAPSIADVPGRSQRRDRISRRRWRNPHFVGDGWPMKHLANERNPREPTESVRTVLAERLQIARVELLVAAQIAV